MNILAAIFTTHLVCAGCNDGDIRANQLIGIEYNGYAAATMINSVYRRSYLALYDHKITEGFGAYLGLATGYQGIPTEIENTGLTPVFAPYMQSGPFKAIIFGDALVFTVQFSVGD